MSDADGRKKMKFVLEQLGNMAKNNWEGLLATED
jgi:hypothetical protein